MLAPLSCFQSASTRCTRRSGRHLNVCAAPAHRPCAPVQYMHIPDREKCNWMRERIETAHPEAYSREKKINMLDRIAWSDIFETFLANKYAAAKRFGLEGAESLVPGMKALIDKSADLGVQNVVIGMPHRGRLNILGNVVRKPLRQIFQEFSGKTPFEVTDEAYRGALPPPASLPLPPRLPPLMLPLLSPPLPLPLRLRSHLWAIAPTGQTVPRAVSPAAAVCVLARDALSPRRPACTPCQGTLCARCARMSSLPLTQSPGGLAPAGG